MTPPRSSQNQNSTLIVQHRFGDSNCQSLIVRISRRPVRSTILTVLGILWLAFFLNAAWHTWHTNDHLWAKLLATSFVIAIGFCPLATHVLKLAYRATFTLDRGELTVRHFPFSPVKSKGVLLSEVSEFCGGKDFGRSFGDEGGDYDDENFVVAKMKNGDTLELIRVDNAHEADFIAQQLNSARLTHEKKETHRPVS